LLKGFGLVTSTLFGFCYFRDGVKIKAFLPLGLTS
jgi:hypothetical protein